MLDSSLVASSLTVMDSGPEHLSFRLGEHRGAYVSCVLCSEQELQSFTQRKGTFGVHPSIRERDAGSQRRQKCNCGKSEDETTRSQPLGK